MKRFLPLSLAILGLAVPVYGNKPGKIIEPGNIRFLNENNQEVPNFRRHVVPLLGKLGCNGRACHGSFQGRGGFRLSLFGYDFKMDHDGLTKGDPEKDKDPRVDPEFPEDSLALLKPTLTMPHKGGKRMDEGSWEYRILHNWIRAGAKTVDLETEPRFGRLEVTPREMVFSKSGETAQLKVIAVWSDGSREDVTPLCRFKSNDDQVAQIDKNGKVAGGQAGDTHVVVFYDNGVAPVPVIRPITDKSGENYPQVTTATKIDELVIDKLSKMGIVPSEVTSDAAFLRRVSLDMTGSLPTPQAIRRFLADDSSDKRNRKIDELLETPAYAAWWATKLCDFTGNNSDTLRNAVPRARGQSQRTASQDWYEWMAARIGENMPYDQLIERVVAASSRNPGESYTEFSEFMSDLYGPSPTTSFTDRHSMPYFWARQNIRQPEEKAIAFAYSFLGIRIQCANCHKHPFDQWTQDDFKQFRSFFTGIQGYRGTNPASRKEYDEIIAKLEIDTKVRGNQVRREFARLLGEGKTVPFPEIYLAPPQQKRGADNAVKAAKRQAKALQSQIEEAQAADKVKVVQSLKQRLAALQIRLTRLQQRADQASSTAKLLGGDIVRLDNQQDARQPLMQWMRHNPLFAKAFVNRVWANYFNVGLVEPTDDLSLANPPTNKPLFEYLSQGFVDSGFDMKWLHREIANSDTYQRSWQPNDTNAGDERNFSHAIPRRLPAEVAYDAIKQATASDEQFAQMQKDMQGRAIAIAGSSAPRGNRGNAGPAYALTIFGRSIRESNCDCDRTSDPTLMQTVFLQNDQEVFDMIDSGGWVSHVARELGIRSRPGKARTPRKPRNFEQQLANFTRKARKLRQQGNEKAAEQVERQLTAYQRRFQPPKSAKPEKLASLDSAAIVRNAYLRTLSRLPRENELLRSQQFVEESEDTLNGVRGLLWALLNTKEFIVNH